MKVKGVKIEFFTLCIAFRKVIFFIYQKIYLSDRVPLSVAVSGRGFLSLREAYILSGWWWVVVVETYFRPC